MPQPQNGAVTIPNPVGENIPDNTAPTNDAAAADSPSAVVTTIAPSESEGDNIDNAPVVNTFPIETPATSDNSDNTPNVTSEHRNHGGNNNNEDAPHFLVVPESPIGLIALFGSSLATLGAYLFYQRSH